MIRAFFQEKWGDDWETLGRDQDSIIRQMNILRKKDLDSNIEISPILEYLTETLLRKLFHKNWSSFAPFLTPMSKVDFFAKYDYLLKIRNHHAHANAKFLSEENRQQADKYLREIGDAVSNSYEKTFILIEEEDEIYEVMMYENSKGNQFKYCVYKGKNALFHPEALVEEGDEIILKVIPKENTTPNELIKNTYPLKILSGTYEKL